jgi:hypothetical protein
VRTEPGELEMAEALAAHRHVDGEAGEWHRAGIHSLAQLAPEPLGDGLHDREQRVALGLRVFGQGPVLGANTGAVGRGFK